MQRARKLDSIDHRSFFFTKFLRCLFCSRKLYARLDSSSVRLDCSSTEEVLSPATTAPRPVKFRDDFSKGLAGAEVSTISNVFIICKLLLAPVQTRRDSLSLSLPLFTSPDLIGLLRLEPGWRGKGTGKLQLFQLFTYDTCLKVRPPQRLM